MNPAWWLIAPLALLVVWWLAGRPGWPRSRAGRDDDAQGEAAAAIEAGAGRSTVAEPPEAEPAHGDFAPTTVMPHAAEDEIRREREELAARAAREAAERAAAEQEAVLRAAYRAADEAQARRVAEREAAEALARQQAADEHARRELVRQQQLEAEAAERRRLDAEAAARQAAAAAAAAAATPPPPALVRLPEQTLVMVVDDSKVVRVKTSRLLAKHQYRVVLAENGEQALLQIASEAPQVLITDVEMPGIDGIELTRRVRANAATAQLPIIMITSADDRLRGVADEVGVSVLLGKPYADEALIASIEQLAGIAASARLSHA